MSAADNKRGALAALAGLVVQAALTGLLLGMWLTTRTLLPFMVFLLLLGGLGVWLVSAILFYCRHLAEVESREMAQLAAERGGSAIFADEAAELKLAQRRLRRMERFLSPILTVTLAGVYFAAATMLGRALLAGAGVGPRSPRELTWGLFCLGGAFVAFLFGRYAIGMSKNAVWRLLRAGGSFLNLSAAAVALAGTAFIFLHMDLPLVYQVSLYAVPAVLALLGVEMLLNFVLDFYRPRVGSVEARPSFDSRLTSLLSEPGSIAHSIAEALNYQFGFEVSGTWFYKLLQKAVLPLLLFGAAALIAISSVVLVGPGEQAMVLTWGKIPPHDARPLGPGLHLKLPWPVQTVDLVAVERVRTLRIGVGEGRQKEEVDADYVGPEGGRVLVYLWQREHGELQERDLLTPAAPRTRTADRQPAQPDTEPSTRPAFGNQRQQAAEAVNYIRLVADLNYRVKNVRQFLYASARPEDVLAKLAERALVQYAGRHDVDALLSSQRDKIGRDIHRMIQVEVDGLGLGIEVLDVLPQGIHPPTELASAFEGVINAERAMEGEILAAQGKSEATLSQAAGSSQAARELAQLVQARAVLERQAGSTPELMAESDKAIDDYFDRNIGGQARALVNQAAADRWERVNVERDRVEAFEKQVLSYTRAPELYTLDKHLSVLAQAMKNARKYIIGVDPSKVEIRYNHEQTRGIGGALRIAEPERP